MLERGRTPRRCRVARLAVGGETLGDVRGICRRSEILLVAAVALGGRVRVPRSMALIAGDRRVGSGERESGFAVIE